MDKQVWDQNPITLEGLHFLRGQKRMLRIIDRLPDEIEKARVRLKEEYELDQNFRKEHDE